MSQTPLKDFRTKVSQLVPDPAVAEEIVKAAEHMFDSAAEILASEISKTLIEATAASLQGVYDTGQYPGRFPSDRMHRLALILVGKGQEAHEQGGLAGQESEPGPER